MSQARETSVQSAAFVLLFSERGDRLGIADGRRGTRTERKRIADGTSSALLETRESSAVVQNRRSDEERFRTEFSRAGLRRGSGTRWTLVRTFEEQRRRRHFRRGGVTRMKSTRTTRMNERRTENVVTRT